MSQSSTPAATTTPSDRLPIVSIFRKPHDLATHGCSHLKELKKQPEFFKSYQLLARFSWTFRYRQHLSLSKKEKKNIFTEMGEDETMSAKKRKKNIAMLEAVFSTIEQLPIPQCHCCESTFDKLHMCLSCVFVGCFSQQKHIQAHCEEKGHLAAFEFSHGSVFCFGCKDYVHDLDLEKILYLEQRRMMDILSMIKEPTYKRTKFSQWNPSSMEAEIIRKKSKPIVCSGIRGLRNMGSTCFMNAVLQTFIHNPLLRGHFLSDRHNSNLCTLSLCLACQMDKLFSNFYNGTTLPYGPTSFLHAMWISQEHLAGYSEKDAHEFLISVLNEIHNNCGGSENISTCQCIIHNTFAGTLQSDVTCLKCGNVTTAFDPILDISLDVKNTVLTKKVSKKKSAPVEPGSADTSTTLLECLDMYTRPERLGPNAYSCSACENTFQESTKQLSVKKLPPVLSIQLKRFEHSVSATSKIETQVHFPIDLDMTPYSTRWMTQKSAAKKRRASAVSPDHTPNIPNPARRSSSKPFHFDPIKESIPSHRYTLFGVINHTGKLETGHYTAFVKAHDEWFLFDDHLVTSVSQKQVLSGQPYMLFYIRQSYEFSPLSAIEAAPHHTPSVEAPPAPSVQ